MSLMSRHSPNDSSLIRLSSRSGKNLLEEQLSCPTSPAVKKVYRLVVAGSARTGKTSIVNRFLNDNFEERYIPTIENFHRKHYKIRGEIHQLDILDLSGNNPFPETRKVSYLGGDMFMVVGAVDRSESIAQMMEIRNQIIESKSIHRSSHGDPIPMLFVVNKTDLPSSKWEIDYDEVCQRIAKITNAVGNVSDCSAANSTNIDVIFGQLFVMAKLPKFMNPEFHKVLRNELSADVLMENDKRKKLLQRMKSHFSRDETDASCYMEMNAQRPSIRTDLLLHRVLSSGSQTSGRKNSKKRCIIS